ncbi:MAG: serine/threonine protein kinase, partial [Planctomycetales bacterium]|nr:serine/threonine protein kinase [Planctomycetales bacterium]
MGAMHLAASERPLDDREEQFADLLRSGENSDIVGVLNGISNSEQRKLLEHLLRLQCRDMEAAQKPEDSASERSDETIDLGSSIDRESPHRQDAANSHAAGQFIQQLSEHSTELPRRFGNYELLQEVGRGGMGVVFRARQIDLDRVVALKMIVAGQLASPEQVQRFRTEASTAASLEHPGIVPIFEVGELNGQHYFSMQYIEGESLADRLSAGPLPPREAACMALKIADAIAYAHQQGVIHRDLKPANVLLDESKSLRITDFGLAKRIADEDGLTETGQILGTPGYMAPEQALGEETDFRADLYALGVLLFESVTGRALFPQESLADIVS